MGTTGEKKKELRLMIVDDHPIVRDGLGMLIRCTPGFRLAAACADGEEACAACREAGWPDAVIMDVRMPGRDGFETLELLKGLNPDVRVLLLAGMPLQAEVKRARGLGAAGYLPKSCSQERLLDAVRMIVADKEAFVQEPVDFGTGSVLTNRETETLRLLSTGLSYEEIGDSMGISAETVKSHVKSVYCKLGVHAGPAAVGVAYNKGILRA